MNGFQIIYTIALTAIFMVRGPSFAAGVLLGNLAATLLACLAMDLGWLDRNPATLTMCLIDLVSGAVLLSSPGLPRIIAAGYAITVPLYTANLIFGVQIGATFAIVNAVALLQVMVALIGSGGGDFGGGRRSADVADSLALSGGDQGMGQNAAYQVYQVGGRVDGQG